MPLRLLAFALIALAASGCEDDVDPTLGIDAPFSLYGYLDPTADRQAIRVAQITSTIGDSADVFEATVVSTDLSTGATTAWRDSLVSYPSGVTGHVFVADYTPRPGTTHRIEATAPDGASTTVDVDVPPIIQAEVGNQGSAPGEITYPIRFEGAPRVLNGQLRLTAVGFPGEDASVARRLTIPLDVVPVEVAPDVWEVTIPFLTATRRYLQDEGLLGQGIRLVVADYVGFVTGESWALPTTDVDALVEPGTFSNVEGGFGFVGGGYFATARWTPSASAQSASGFSPSGDPAEAVAINEIRPGAGGWVEFYNPLYNNVSLNGYSITNDQTRPRLQTFSFEVNVPARGFYVVPLAFTLGPREALALFDRGSNQVSRVVVPQLAGEASNVTYGSFPDGLSFQVPPALGGFNVFRGTLLATPGAPNVIGLDFPVINEVYTEGSNGFAEVVGGDASLQPSTPVLFSEADGFFDAVAASGLSFGIAPETAGGLDLVQGGGTVYLALRHFDPSIIEVDAGGNSVRVFTTRVVDVRRYDGQIPGRSEGYLPDGRTGTWTPDLRPTPGAGNAAVRLGL
ncbi:hypothetical protein [Rubrivirga sp. IMCC43871]|uniref:hypothetical protein n=1 Tax=Rubrivirga sp. IMCC43871 TaxID=3391575 RepID=UPI00398FE8E3